MNFRTVAAGMILVSTGAQADTEVQALPPVEIVGSRLPRMDAETALPVQIIRREEIERSGASTVEELLGLVSANFGSTPEAVTTANSLVSGRSSASLRGLGATRTLVLLNGRRIANYAFSGNFGGGVDLHAIPLAAIERVEVLKDGASALYGSDAIGGVINFVTRRDFAGVDVFGSYTKTEAGGADSGRATVAAGTGRLESEGFNVFGVFDLRNAERLKGSERSFSTHTYRPELGAAGNDPRTWPADIRIPRPTGGLDILYLNFPACPSDSFPLRGGCRFNNSEASDLLPSSRQAGFFGMGTLRLSAQTDVYAEVLASTSHIRHEDPPTAVSTAESQHGTPFVLPPSSPYYPTGVTLPSNWSLAYRTVPLGPSTTEVESNNVRVLVGLKSRQWDCDLDGAIATNRTWSRERYVSGMIDAGRLSAAFATGLLNPFGPSGPQGDALLSASEVRGVSRESSGLTQYADLRAIRELTALPGGPLGMALGVEVRRESLEDVKMPIATDVLGYTPSAPKQGSRHVQAAYVEIVAPLAKGFEIQAAARADHYSDFGTAFSPKVAMRLEAAPGLLLRASAGRGFRAPSLNELYTQQSHTFLELATIPLGPTDPVRCPVTHLPSDCQPGVDFVTGGNPALQPQRSTQSSLGIVVVPGPGWLASLDLWRIHIDSNIGVIDFDQLISHLVLYDGRNVKRGPVDPAFPSLPGPLLRIENLTDNLGDWRVSGVDVSASTPRATTAAGRISAHLDGTYVKYARQNISAVNVVDQVGRVSPRWQSVLAVNLDQERWLGTLLYRYRHGYSDVNLLPDGSSRHVAAYQLWDAQAEYTLARNVKLLIGVQNLLDANPPYSNVGPQVGFDPTYADPRGRRWTVGFRASWS